jgi:hypothetical protein
MISLPTYPTYPTYHVLPVIFVKYDLFIYDTVLRGPLKIQSVQMLSLLQQVSFVRTVNPLVFLHDRFQIHRYLNLLLRRSGIQVQSQ